MKLVIVFVLMAIWDNIRDLLNNNQLPNSRYIWKLLNNLEQAIIAILQHCIFAVTDSSYLPYNVIKSFTLCTTAKWYKLIVENPKYDCVSQ